MGNVSVTLMAELSITGNKAGFELKDYAAMVHDVGLMRKIRGVIRGELQVSKTVHAVDLDSKPFVPEGWFVESHKKGGQFIWNPKALKLHFGEEQEGNRYINGKDLHKKLETIPVMNTNLLFWLLDEKHQYLIPEKWKNKKVCFWGTIYRSSGDGLYVYYLEWKDDKWSWHYMGIWFNWDSRAPALVLTNHRG